MQVHVVFGSGQVGAPLVRLLLEAGHRVRVVKRTRERFADGVELVIGDAFDRAFCVNASAGATAVYHCLNVAYSTKAWAAELPKFQDNLIEAAGRAGARLVVLENLYMLGRPNGPLNEDTLALPVSRKGELRRKLSEALFAAHRAGTVRAAAGRASDLFGAGVAQSQIGEHLFRRVLAGKSAQVFGNPDALHSFSYAPDVARGLAALGSTDDTLGRAWMLPVMPPMSSRAFYDKLFASLAVKPRLSVISPFMLSALGLFMASLRELVEMNYQWENDFVVSDAHFRARFKFGASALDDALRSTAAWAIQTFGPSAAPHRQERSSHA